MQAMNHSAPIPSARWVDQQASWPERGEHILAHQDADTIVVYQAYRPEIGQWAIRHGQLGGPAFSFNRMSWVKPNFLWMMYRSGWGTKEGQEVTLGLRIRRTFFDRLLSEAVPSSFEASGMQDRDAWVAAVQASDVRLQWDPDHAPDGARLERRAVQLGLRGAALAELAEAALLEVIDMTEFVAEQRTRITGDWSQLMTPTEWVYPNVAQVSREVSGLSNHAKIEASRKTVTLYRPTGPKELALVAESGYRRWPPRLPEQPIFYPVTNETYAVEIARDWNVPQSGSGYVTRFEVLESFMQRYETHIVGGARHEEWWIPAEELEAFNANIVGQIEVIHSFTT